MSSGVKSPSDFLLILPLDGVVETLVADVELEALDCDDVDVEE